MIMKKSLRWLTLTGILIGVTLIAVAGWQLFESSGLSWQDLNIFRPVDREDEDVSKPSEFFQQLTSEGGSNPKFSFDGSELFYFTANDQLAKININNGTKVDGLMPLPLLPIITWDEMNEVALMEWQVSPEGGKAIGYFDTSDFEVKQLMDDAWGLTWTTNDEIVFLMTENDRVGIWRMNMRGSQQVLLGEFPEMEAPRYLAWSKLEHRMIAQSALKTSIYTVQNDVAIHVNDIPWAEGARWSPSGWMLAFRINEGDVDSLWVSNLDGKDNQKLFEGVFSEVNWLPDDRLVFFTPGKEGGAACWAIDPHTGQLELLADSSVVVLKPVGSITVSPQGDALAFEAQDRQIWLLRLESNNFDQKP
jgi:hypothetical protein